MGPSMRRVLRSEELVGGSPTQPEIRRARAGEADILLARLEDEGVVAFATTCPHQDTSLEDATVWDGNLRCPRHLYLYDPRTGENVLPARDTPPEALWKLRPGYLPVYRVEEREGWIWVADAPQPPPAAYDPEKERRPARPPEPEMAAPVVEQAGPLEHPTQTVVASAGEELEVLLSTSPRPGHLWRGEVPNELVVVSQRIDADQPSNFRVRLRAGPPGQAAMRWSYARPWDVTPAEVRTFVVLIGPEPSA
jgi:nitrite reductase/ring-hydroxylating ferredoxin subunit